MKGVKLIEEGRPDEAERQLREVLLARGKPSRPDDRPLVLARTAHGAAQFALSWTEEALATYTTARAQAERHHSADPALALSIRNSIVTVLGIAGRHAEAESQATSLAQDAKAAGHRLAILHYQARVQLNNLLHMTGRPRQALTADCALLQDMTQDLGAQHYLVLQCRVLRARRLAVLGHFGDAEAECSAVMATAAEQAGKQRAASAGHAAARALAFCLMESGRPAEAERVVRARLAAAEQLNGLYSKDAQPLRYSLAFALVGQGRCDQALALADIRPAWGGFDHGDHYLLRAEALHGLGRTREAETAATHALDEATIRVAPTDHRVLRIRTLLALIRNSPDQLEAVAADWSRYYGPDHPRAKAARAAS